MRSRRITSALLICLACAWASVVLGGPGAQRNALKLEAHLIWGTSAEKSPNPDHKPVDQEIKDKLKGLPLKWTNYFEVTRRTIEVSPGESNEVQVSPKCKIVVRALNSSTVEVSLFGKGSLVFKQTQALPKGELLILGGQAPNSTSWLVAVKRIK